MTTRAASLGTFVLRTLLCLPLCFAAWYFSARHYSALVGWLAYQLVDLLTPGIVSGLEQSSGLDLAFVTTIEMQAEPGQIAVLVLEVNPLLYTYGLAFFVALMLAARTNWWKILAGALVLIPFQSWGIAFDFLVQVGVKLGPEISVQAGITGWSTEATALGYQIGKLIFPSLIPVVIWAVFSPQFIGGLLRSNAHDTLPDT